MMIFKAEKKTDEEPCYFHGKKWGRSQTKQNLKFEGFKVKKFLVQSNYFCSKCDIQLTVTFDVLP